MLGGFFLFCLMTISDKDRFVQAMIYRSITEGSLENSNLGYSLKISCLCLFPSKDFNTHKGAILSPDNFASISRQASPSTKARYSLPHDQDAYSGKPSMGF